jgi:hypothetical protein
VKISTKQQAYAIDCIVQYVDDLIEPILLKIVVSQIDYERNPFYGLNQLPSFISPFTDEFTYEIKFLKTYLNTYLKNSLRLDTRKTAGSMTGFRLCHDENILRRTILIRRCWVVRIFSIVEE